MAPRRGSFTPSEVRAIIALVEANGKPVSSVDLGLAVTNGRKHFDSSSVTNIVHRLRSGLGARIQTIRGHGYSLKRHQ